MSRVSYGQIYGPGNYSPSLWDVRKTPLYNDPANPWQSGENIERTTLPIATMYVNRIERTCRLYVGSGKRYLVGELRPGTRFVLQMPSGIDEYTFEWSGPDFAAFADSEETGSPVAELWLSSEPFFMSAGYDPGRRVSSVYQPASPGLNASDISFQQLPLEAPFTASLPILASTASVPGFSNAGDATGFAVPTPKIAASMPFAKYFQNGDTAYPGFSRAGFRTYAASSAGIVSATFGAGTPRALLSLWKGVSANRKAKLHHVSVQILSSSAATELTLTLDAMSTQSTGGATVSSQQTAINTAIPTSTALTEARQFATTLGTSAGRIATRGMILGVTGAASVVNPPPVSELITLWGDTFPDSVMSPEMEAFTDYGFAVVLTSSVSSTIRCTWNAVWTEEENL